MATAVAPRPAMAGGLGGRVAAAVALLSAAAGASVMALGDVSTVTGRTPEADVTHLAGLVLVGAAAAVSAERHAMAAKGLALYVITLALAQAAALAALPDRAQQVLSATGLLGVVAAACVTLGWRTAGGRGLAASASLVTVGFAVLVVGFNPLHEPRCPVACPDVPAIAHLVPDSRAALAAAACLSVAGVVVVVAAAWRARTRPWPLVVAVAGVTAAASSAAPFAVRAVGWYGSYDVSAVMVLPSAGGIAVAVAVLARTASEARARVAAARVAEVISGLDDDRVTPAGVQFAVPGENRWIDATGAAAAATAGSYVVVADRGTPLARVPSRARPGNAEESLGPAQMLAVRNAQLAALARLRVDQLQQSRRRIVGASDAENRRIERDLHDGAQQRLVSSMLYIAVARGAEPDLTELDDAELAISASLEHLRALAHGIYPEILRSEGVWAALEDLARGSPIPVRVAWSAPMRPPEPVGHALFAATAGVLELACASPAAEHVVLAAESGAERVAVHVGVVHKSLAPEDLVDAEDRVGALGGRLELTTPGTDTHITLELPCAS